VLVLGITYKPNVADTRESPPLAVLDRLLDKGAHVEYHDPFVPEIAVNGRSLASVMIDEATVRDADCVVVATNHSSYDWQWIIEHAQLIVDTRNVTAKLPATSRAQCARIVKLGAPSVDHPRGI
jgi:UDP-N-acetyl-D-glucosamine dehydrogenase